MSCREFSHLLDARPFQIGSFNTKNGRIAELTHVAVNSRAGSRHSQHLEKIREGEGEREMCEANGEEKGVKKEKWVSLSRRGFLKKWTSTSPLPLYSLRVKDQMRSERRKTLTTPLILRMSMFILTRAIRQRSFLKDSLDVLLTP